MKKRSKLDAHAPLLGVFPDIEVAKRAGVSAEAVRQYRKKHGIPAPQITKEELQAVRDRMREVGRGESSDGEVDEVPGYDHDGNATPYRHDDTKDIERLPIWMGTKQRDAVQTLLSLCKTAGFSSIRISSSGDIDFQGTFKGQI